MIPLEATILPPERVIRALPLNFKAGDEKLFQHELVRDLNAARSVIVRNVDVLQNGFVTSGARVLDESFTSSPKPAVAVKRWIKMVAYRMASRTAKGVEKGFFATDEFSNGYFHWICDVLPRLEAAYGPEIRQRTFLLPAMADFPYTAPSLEPYGFSSVSVASWRERIRCNELLIVTQAAPTGNYRPSLMHSLRARFRDYFGTDPAGGKLYISRARAPLRHIANEEQVAAVMESHGYQKVFLENLSLKEQVRLVGSARVLVGNHGAGLANITWMLPGTTVLELRLRDDGQNNCYFSLASALDINYRYLSCNPAATEASAHSADLVVDIDRLDEELAAIP
jgi:capsular polysaccharide biosynthesis protein